LLSVKDHVGDVGEFALNFNKFYPKQAELAEALI